MSSLPIKLEFTIGHSASRKTKPSRDGFTHDWELFIYGGSESNDISHFVDKVVFNLHESFPKPRRTFKEPPYVLKESGYAGFILPIDVYFKNKEEPKKVTFNYDMDLQPHKKEKREFVVVNPSDEFRRKCLKGGGFVPTNISAEHKLKDFSKTTGSSVSGSSESKKHKRPDDNKTTAHNFFGNIVKQPTLKLPSSGEPRSQSASSPNPMKTSSGGKGGVDKMSSSSTKEKSDKDKSKHPSSKEKESKESKKSDEKSNKTDESKKKDKKDKDRDRSKEKSSKRSSSPRRSPKRPTSPPSQPSTQSSAARNNLSTNSSVSSIPTNKNENLSKLAGTAASTSATSGSSQKHAQQSSESVSTKKSSKKDKKSYEKERERPEKKELKKEISVSKERLLFDSSSKNIMSKEKESILKDDKDKVKNKILPDVKSEKHDKESDRKHKHKKKEKEKKEKDSKDRKEKRDKDKSGKVNRHESPAISVTANDASKYDGNNANSRTSRPSDKESSSDPESPPQPSSIKMESDNSNSIPDALPRPMVTQPVPPEPAKSQRKSRDKPKSAEKVDKKQKRKLKDEGKLSSSPPAKILKRDHSKSPMPNDRRSVTPTVPNAQTNNGTINNNNENSSGGSQPVAQLINNDYMTELKDLKNKITTLTNSEELQYVVELIAATGCYEITKSTFDFDLCQLDRNTVQRLQEFLTKST